MLGAVYFACSIPMYYCYSGGFAAGGFTVMYCYLAALIFVLFTFGYFLVSPDVERMAGVLRFTGILCLPYLLTMLYSLTVWTLNLTEPRVMIRGFFWPMYQILAILMAASAVYCFGRMGAYYQLSALLAACALLLIGFAREGGPGQLLYELWRVLATFSKETGPILFQLERVAYAHGMGVFLLYLFFTWKENRINRWFLLPVVFFFCAGLKRSALLGLAAAFAAVVMAKGLSREGKGKFVLFLGGAMAAAGFLYVWAISSRVFDMAVELLGINTMGRSEIYRIMRDYYDFSPAFWGKGLGFVSYSIGQGLIDIGNTSRGDIHNDILRQYIELGMFGFLIWLGTFFPWRIRAFLKRVDVRHGMFAAALSSYCLVCYMTENMYYRFNTGLAIAVVILSYAVQREEQKKLSL